MNNTAHVCCDSFFLRKQYQIRKLVQGKISSVEVDGSHRGKKYIEYIANDKHVGLFLGGNKKNAFKDFMILLDRDVWDKMQKYRWSVASSDRKHLFICAARFVGGVQQKITLSTLIMSARGYPTGRVYTIDNPFDFRFKNLTTTNMGAISASGEVGITQRVDKRWRAQISGVCTTSYVGSVSTKIEAQQLYNATLLQAKMNKLFDLRLFGCLHHDGVLVRMFPDGYYDKEGMLDEKYRDAFAKHQHLVVPIPSSTLKKEKELADLSLESVP